MKKDIPIPAEIFYDKRLGHSERMVLIALYSFSNPTTSIAKPSLKGLCLRAGFKSQSSIKTCLRNLEKHDWIQVKAKKGSPNQYKLSTQPIFGGTLEEGRALPSTTYSLTKLNKHYLTHTHKIERAMNSKDLATKILKKFNSVRTKPMPVTMDMMETWSSILSSLLEEHSPERILQASDRCLMRTSHWPSPSSLVEQLEEMGAPDVEGVTLVEYRRQVSKISQFWWSAYRHADPSVQGQVDRILERMSR